MRKPITGKVSQFDFCSEPTAILRAPEGLQCHTSLFSWKVAFESQHRLYELLFSACSKPEENQWRKHLNERNCIETLDLSYSAAVSQDTCSFLRLELRSIGTLLGQPKSIARRISIHRAATVGSKSQIKHVVIRNTESVGEGFPSVSSSSSLPLSRSRSVFSAGQIHVLAPKRSARIHMENAIADVWTKDQLPYPGMKSSESHLRASASHLIRKLSIASITNTFSRRSSGHELARALPPRWTMSTEFSLHNTRSKTPAPNLPATQDLHSPRTRPSANQKPITIDFHKTPEMFLPPDFELKDPRLAKRQLKKVNFPDDSTAQQSVEQPKPPKRLQRSASTRLSPVTETAAEARPATSLAQRRPDVETSRQLTDSTKSKENQALGQKSPRPLGHHLRKLFASREGAVK